ncbi:MAG: hypothetical protein MZV64_04100 [Ignavibacteriales bacterium]|nr:hypothetical protein [Ignavibacteriales bacterium]
MMMAQKSVARVEGIDKDPASAAQAAKISLQVPGATGLPRSAPG